MAETQGGTVLLIDDADGLAVALNKLAGELGRRCERLAPASCTEAALEAARPELVVLGGNGASLCARLREERVLATAKILVLSGSDRDLERRRFLALGADGYLAQPCPIAALRGEFGRLLGPGGGM